MLGSGDIRPPIRTNGIQCPEETVDKQLDSICIKGHREKDKELFSCSGHVVFVRSSSYLRTLSVSAVNMMRLCRWLLLQAAMGVILSGGQSALVAAMPLPGKSLTSSWHHRLRHRNSQRRAKQLDIESIKNDLLDKLGLDQVPDVSKFNKTLSVQELRRKLKEYRKSRQEARQLEEPVQDEEDDLMLPEVYHRIIDYGFRPSFLHEVNTTGRVHLYFPLSITHPEDPYRYTHVHSAKLRINVVASKRSAYRNDNHLEQDAVRLSVYQLVPHVVSGHRVVLRRLADSSMVPISTSGWLTFDIRAAVEDWLDDPDSNWGLEVDCESTYKTDAGAFFLFFLPDPDLGLDPEAIEDCLPHVNVLTQERQVQIRSRRSEALGADCDDGETKCCRMPVVINFEDIGWDFIIEPKSITVYYCVGSCPNGYRPAHNFVSVQTLLHRWKPKDIPAPCCAPSEMEQSDFFLMFDNQGHLVQEQIDNFIVRSCKCT